LLRLHAPTELIGAGRWHDIVVRFNRATLEMLVDGVLLDEDWPHGNLHKFIGPFLIGAGFQDGKLLSGFHGQIDHVDESQARVDMINAAGPDLLLSVHQNAFYGSQGEPAEDVGGTVTFYCADRAFSDRNLRFAQLVQDAVVEAFRDAGHDVRDRGVEEDLVLKTPDEPGSYLILLGPKTERIVRPCQVPGALSETMFLTHRREGELARDPAILDRLALAYAKAICGYFEEDQSLGEQKEGVGP